MFTHQSTPKRPIKPPPPPLIPGWVWAGVIVGAVLIILFVTNTIGAGLAGPTGGTSLVCYPFQLIAYLFNGILAGTLEKSRYLKKVKRSPLTPRPNYFIVGALAGLVASLFAAVVYVATTAALVALVPPGIVLFGLSTAILIVIDFVAAIGLGLMGGFVYERIFA